MSSFVNVVLPSSFLLLVLLLTCIDNGADLCNFDALQTEVTAFCLTTDLQHLTDRVCATETIRRCLCRPYIYLVSRTR